MTIKEFLAGIKLGLVSRTRLNCPSCRGRNTLSVSPIDAGYLWNCFSASCDFRGKYTDRYGNTKNLEEVKKKKVIDTDYFGYRRYPITDANLECVGWVHRAKDKRTFPKVINNYDPDWVGLHFPRSVTKEYVLLVEDRASAEKMAPLFPTVALLGTVLNQEKIDYLIKQGIKYAIMALDYDATAKAIRYKKEYSFIEYVHIIYVDYKDCTDSELMEQAGKLNTIIINHDTRATHFIGGTEG